MTEIVASLRRAADVTKRLGAVRQLRLECDLGYGDCLDSVVDFDSWIEERLTALEARRVEASELRLREEMRLLQRHRAFEREVVKSVFRIEKLKGIAERMLLAEPTSMYSVGEPTHVAPRVATVAR